MLQIGQVVFMFIISLAFGASFPAGLTRPDQEPATGLNGRWEGVVVVGGGAVTLPFAVVFSDSATGPVAAFRSAT